ncbi:hypothetical protein CBR_g3032 [Chara braunii]|uniref:MAT1 centre domain-containing protein n=1 Tax=Chara braunii TaxID=69332 RepID=A0A388KEK5_CHABU|nr:hypothetical protein CBR_g3032 [Chara braunii]|eukprot:GBG68488.1 hypothetical protein CBR_g3032 [Chara braunii]
MVALSFSAMNSKEVIVRKRIVEIYNKQQEDFGTLREYNDYLEEVEDIIFALVEGHDVEAVEAKIAKYKEENYEQIVMAQARKAEERAAQLRE